MTELDSLLENLPTMVFVKDAKDLRFVRVNRAAEFITGYSRDVFLGKSDYDLFPKEQADFFIAQDRAVLAGKEIVDIPEEPIQTRDRGIRFLHTKKIPIFDSNGEPLFLLGISEDITELKLIQAQRLQLYREEVVFKEREASIKRTEFLSEASLILASSLDYRQNLNQLGARVVSEFCDWCTMSIIKKENTFERVVSIHRDPAKSVIAAELKKTNPLGEEDGGGLSEVIASGKSRMGVVRSKEDLLPEAGDRHHLELLLAMGVRSFVIVPVSARERTFGAIAFAHSSDKEFTVEDRFFAEEIGRRAGLAIENALLYESAQKAIEMRDEFLSIASHELKTPLTSLKLYAQVTELKMARDPAVVLKPEYLGKLLSQFKVQIDRIGRLVDDMLDISRLDRKKLTIHREQFNLVELVSEVIERLSAQVASAGCEFKVSHPGEVVGNWDRFRIEQVITNILSNALKFSPSSLIAISVNRIGDNVELRVRDQGKGIAEADHQRIFQQFERAVSYNEVSGFGLGLFIAKQIVDMHEGSIRVESELGKGAEFIVSLPVRVSEAHLKS